MKQHIFSDPGQIKLFLPAPLFTSQAVIDAFGPRFGNFLSEVRFVDGSEFRNVLLDLGGNFGGRKAYSCQIVTGSNADGFGWRFH